MSQLVLCCSFILLTLLAYSEVKFYDHGLKSFEVIDNGSGISPEDYENVGERVLLRR